jgi:phosphate starvation-inducible PhoH-like protein
MSRKPNDAFIFNFEPKTYNQREAVRLYDENSVLFILGPAGTGKSHLAVALALRDLHQKKVRKIILTRPLVEAGERLGFLPGEVEEKIGPYLAPLHEILGKVSYNLPKDSVQGIPLALLQGYTFENAVAILDEWENATLSQIKLFLTRLGHGSKMVITGDINQTCIPGNAKILNRIIRSLSPLPGVGVITFDANDNMRHPLINKILEALA